MITALYKFTNANNREEDNIVASPNILGRFKYGIQKVYQRLQPLMIYIPFSPLNVVWNSLDKNSQSILDVGCGRGQPMDSINRRGKFYTVGVDIYAPDLEQCKAKGIHDKYLMCDIRNLPFEKKSFDIVMCLSVIEHFDKVEGRNLMQAMEQIARRQVVIAAPVGEWRHKDIDNDPNPFQRHRSIWTPSEFKKLGYEVRGSDVERLFDEKGLFAHVPKIFAALHVLFWILVGPFVFFLPGLAGQQICSKKLDILK